MIGRRTVAGDCALPCPAARYCSAGHEAWLLVERPRCTKVYCHWAAPSNTGRVVITQSWRALCCQVSLLLGIGSLRLLLCEARHDHCHLQSSNPRIVSRQSPLSSRSCSKTGEPLQLAERRNSNSTWSRPDCQSRQSLLPHQTSPHLGELCLCQCVCSSRILSSTLAGPTCRSSASSLPASRTMSVAHSQGAAARDKHLRLCTCSLIVPSARFLQSSDSMPASC